MWHPPSDACDTPLSKLKKSLLFHTSNPRTPFILGFASAFLFFSFLHGRDFFGSEFNKGASTDSYPSCSMNRDGDASSRSPCWGKARRPRVLREPSVILISADGFRWGYNLKVDTPNLDRIRLNGTEAETGLIPVFPSVTFPNHYSIVTGLYPVSHGIIANRFSDPANPHEYFTTSNIDPKWWLGEPIWQTATKQGLKAATYFWPGSEVLKYPWNCSQELCEFYDESVSFTSRVDTVLEWMSLPEGSRPHFVSLYFEEPDTTGHMFGPDSPQTIQAITIIDSMVGRLLDGLQELGILDDVHVIFLGDHGMLSNCEMREIYLDKVSNMSMANLTDEAVDTYFPLLAIRPKPPAIDSKAMFHALNSALESGNISNANYLSLYLKKDFPSRFHYSDSDRIQPILGLASESYSVAMSPPLPNVRACFGSHGYDNLLLSMRTVFFAMGPRFAQGRKVPSFMNIQVYNVLADLLNINPAPNNGSDSFASDFLLQL